MVMSPLPSSFDLNLRSKESLLNAITTKEGRQKVVSLQGDDAENALTLLQKELDAFGSQRDSRFRTAVSRIILRLADGSHRVPANLWISHIEEGVEVARGAYGVVHKGSWKGEVVALKFLHGSVEDDFNEKTFREVIIWRQVSHKNVLPFLGLFRDGLGKVAMVAPWQSGGNLVEFIRNHPGEDRHKLLIQATSGLTYLHELDIVHSDLKPENILISHENRAMLADFGLSHMQCGPTELIVSSKSDHFGVKGTIPYCAPEIFGNTPSQHKTPTSRDIWALGMVVYRLFTGNVPFSDRPYPKGTCDAITSGVRPKSRKYQDKQRGFTDELWDFLDNYCWNMSQEKRPSARDCEERLKELRSRWKIEKATKLASPFPNLEEVISVPQNYLRTLFNGRKPYLQSLSEQFGVRIAEGTYGKIWGDKINVEAAIKDIISDYENWSVPQKTTFLSVPSRLKGAIIGQGGDSVKALEEEYSVKVTIDGVGEQVSIKGPPDNVERAKAGLQSKVEYLQLYDDIRQLQVNEKLITRLRSQKYLQESREELGLRKLGILTDTSITMRGSKQALDKAEAHFCRLQEEYDREVTLTLTEDIDILSRLVTGQSWLDIVRSCNGPSNPTLQRALVTLRREENEVILTGGEALINRLRDQLYLEVLQRREIVLGMKISRDLHRDLLREYDINEIQRTARVLISFPGGDKYNILPEPHNLLDDLFEVEEPDIVKIRGTLQACITARQMLEAQVREEKLLQRKVTFGAKYQDEVQCLILPQLKSLDIRVLTGSSSCELFNPPDLAPLPQKPWISWGLKRRFDRTDTADCTLELRAKRNELDEAVEIVKQAVRKVSAASYIGCLKFSKETKFGHLIGHNGDTVRRLQLETHTKIDVANANADKDPCTVKIIGSKKHVEQARDKIVRLLDSKWITMENATSG